MNQKVWLITGASKGMGLEIAKAALLKGDSVVATVRKGADELQKRMNNEKNLFVVQFDVTDELQVKTGVAKALKKFGRIDVLINNAGYGLLAAIEEATDEETRRQFDTNVFGLLNVIRAVLPQMRMQRSGHIINISSLFAYKATVPGLGIYSSTKSAVEGISEGLALEVKPFGINVTAIAPGFFRTKFVSPDSYQTSKLKLDAYDETVGTVRESLHKLDGSQPGDPAKLAQVVLKLVESANPPLHLPIGKDSLDAFKDRSSSMQFEVAGWEDLVASTNH